MNINTTVGNVHITLSDARLQNGIRRAQKKLNMQIVADCTPLVPFRNGALRGSVNYPHGIEGDEIEWNTPYAHYQYIGYLRTDEKGRVSVGKGESKNVLTETPLQYHQKGTGSQWFEKAKEAHLQDWIDLVKKEVGRD